MTIPPPPVRFRFSTETETPRNLNYHCCVFGRAWKQKKKVWTTLLLSLSSFFSLSLSSLSPSLFLSLSLSLSHLLSRSPSVSISLAHSHSRALYLLDCLCVVENGDAVDGAESQEHAYLGHIGDSLSDRQKMGLHRFMPSLSWVFQVLCNVSSKHALAAVRLRSYYVLICLVYETRHDATQYDRCSALLHLALLLVSAK